MGRVPKVERAARVTLRGGNGRCADRTLSNDVKWVELVVVMFIEPGADEIEEPKARAPGESERVDHELRDGSLQTRVGLVVKDVHRAVTDLQYVDVPGQRSVRLDWDGQAAHRPELLEVLSG